MRYAVVIDNAGSNFTACVPDLPACVTTGTTLAEWNTSRSLLELGVFSLLSATAAGRK